MRKPPPILDYYAARRRPSGILMGLIAGIFISVLLNTLPYVLTRGAYRTDGYEKAGFPFTFYRFGGFGGEREFDASALLGDAALAFLSSIASGYAWKTILLRTRSRKH